jgi:hypothetical protein
VSKIPFIQLTSFLPFDSAKVNIDLVAVNFTITDGDADIANDTTSMIWLKDSRFDTAGFIPTPFPPIDVAVENPKKGLIGTCTFYPVPPPTPRLDSFHRAVNRDTFYYQLYITDRAGHKSNVLTTKQLIIY